MYLVKEKRPTPPAAAPAPVNSPRSASSPSAPACYQLARPAFRIQGWKLTAAGAAAPPTAGALLAAGFFGVVAVGAAAPMIAYVNKTQSLEISN
jgi:hypothetical protein